MPTEQQRHAQQLLGALAEKRRALIQAALEHPETYTRGKIAALQAEIEAMERIVEDEADSAQAPTLTSDHSATVLAFTR